jgi:hypothetical protein
LDIDPMLRDRIVNTAVEILDKEGKKNDSSGFVLIFYVFPKVQDLLKNRRRGRSAAWALLMEF